jgi:hypothetical protein
MTMNKLSKFALCAFVLPAGSLAAGVASAAPYADSDADEQRDPFEQQSQSETTDHDAMDRDPMDPSTSEHSTADSDTTEYGSEEQNTAESGSTDYGTQDQETADSGTGDWGSKDQGTTVTEQDPMDAEYDATAGTAHETSDTMKDATYMSSAPADSINVEKVVGSKLQMSSNDEEVGDIDDLVIDESGKIVAAVVNIGGILGMGQHPVAISWDSIERRMNENQDGYSFRVNVTKDDLRNAPTYQQEGSGRRVSSTATE